MLYSRTHNATVGVKGLRQPCVYMTMVGLLHDRLAPPTDRCPVLLSVNSIHQTRDT